MQNEVQPKGFLFIKIAFRFVYSLLIKTLILNGAGKITTDEKLLCSTFIKHIKHVYCRGKVNFNESLL